MAWFAHIGGFVAGPILLLLLGGFRKPPGRRSRRAPGLVKRLLAGRPALLLAARAGGRASGWSRRCSCFQDTVRIDLAGAALRAVHLSDLHISKDRPLLHQLLDEIARGRPDLILISGDFIRDVPEAERLARHIAATAAFLAELRRIAPVIAVQGHSEHQGDVIAGARPGRGQLAVERGAADRPGGGLLLLGLNQQVGYDELGIAGPRRSGRPLAGGAGSTAPGAREPFRNFYSHWDPAPAGLDRRGRPPRLERLRGGLRRPGSTTRTPAPGLVVHSRYVLGEDRHVPPAPGPAEHGDARHVLALVRRAPRSPATSTRAWIPSRAAGTGCACAPRSSRTGVRVLARVWPADGPEPREWQARAEDRSRYRVEAGTVGLWAWGGGTVLYRNLRVTGAAGAVLLDAPLAGRGKPAGLPRGRARHAPGAWRWRAAPTCRRGRRRWCSPTRRHVVLEASRRGLEAVLAGHTHGGQVRLPFVGALTTRDSLGACYDFGRFEFAAPNPRGLDDPLHQRGGGHLGAAGALLVPAAVGGGGAGRYQDLKDRKSSLMSFRSLGPFQLLTTTPAPSSHLRKETSMDRWIVILILGQFIFLGFIIWVVSRSREASLRRRSEERNRLLERFSSSEELTAFLNSEAGSRLLTPKGADHPTRKIVAAVFGGIITLFIGMAFLLVVFLGRDPSGGRLVVPGTICVMVGVGILIAAANLLLALQPRRTDVGPGAVNDPDDPLGDRTMDGVTALPKAGARREALAPRPLTEAEFEGFHARTSQPLWAYLRRISGDPALADDVLQESYLRLLRHPPSADRDERERKAYLFQIATNLMRDRWRARERERSALERLLSFWSPRPERSGGPLSRYGRRARPPAAAGPRPALARPRRGLRPPGDCKVLGLQEGSVRVILFRARKKLEKELA